MLKALVIFILLTFVSFEARTQIISGDLVQSGRKMISDSDFKVVGRYTGFQYYELSVNREGRVTDVRHLVQKGALISTPARILASGKLNELEFQKGTSYPKFHRVKVRVNFEK